jgi:hypothetical protein
MKCSRKPWSSKGWPNFYRTCGGAPLSAHPPISSLHPLLLRRGVGNKPTRCQDSWGSLGAAHFPLSPPAFPIPLTAVRIGSSHSCDHQT